MVHVRQYTVPHINIHLWISTGTEPYMCAIVEEQTLTKDNGTAES